MSEGARADAAWIGAIQEAVAVLSGDRAQRAAADWDQFAAHKLVVVTVFGPIKAGKTSLVKRLLVEADAPAAEWLAVTARPTTFTIGEAACGNLTLVDSPGTGSGDPAHQEKAETALSATDVLLVAWPPSLATDEHMRLAEIICGDFYGHPVDGYFPRGALLMVIGRMDSLHPDVTADVSDFRELRERKEAELRDMLSAMRSARAMQPGPADLVIHGVCADPFELVGRQAQSAPADYDTGRGWDGIAELREALDALPARLPELRAAAAVRYWSRVAKQAIRGLEADDAELAARDREASGEATRLRSLAADLRHVRESAGRDLRVQVVAELRSAAATVPENQEVARAFVEDRLDKVCTAWATKWSAHANTVLDDRVTGSRTLAGRPARDAYRVESFGRLFDHHPADAEPARGSRSAAELMKSLGPHARQVSDAIFEMRLRTTVEAASAELGRLDRARAEGSGDALAKVLKEAVSFKKEPEADRVRDLLRRHGLLNKAVPAVAQLGLILKAEVDGRILERRERERREELRADMENASHEIAARILVGQPEIGEPGLAARLDEILAELDTQARARQVIADQALARRAQLAAAHANLDKLIHERPC